MIIEGRGQIEEIRHLNVILAHFPLVIYGLSFHESPVKLSGRALSERCPAYREFRCNKMTEKQCARTSNRCPFYRGVRLIEVSALRES